jgi:sigma-E factor negative regulatory protein RseC
MITLEISSKELFLRASQLYLMPLLALFVGASISNIFYPANDVIQTFVGLSSLSAVLLFLRHSLK